MSCVTIEEITRLTAGVYKLTISELISGQGLAACEARGVVACLVLKHTQANYGSIVAAWGQEKNDNFRKRLRRAAASVFGAMEGRLLPMIEKIEQGIDAIHEARTHPENASAITLDSIVPLKARPALELYQTGMSQDWWQSNDRAWRAGLAKARQQFEKEDRR